ncbi:MAG TPA: tRNA modification GTPase [Myxococcota bacterium]|nr:tRNA modification GTPase [Myxococcota bacterium]
MRIVACATPWGRAAIAVVRLSGEDIDVLARRFVRPGGGWPPPRRARLAELFDADGVFDEGLLTWMPGPHSYTGEDCLELSCHGNPLSVERLLAAAVSAGARIAEPGEFTRRAFLNGRLDLTRAEAVLQAIEARSARGLEVARAGQLGEILALSESLRQGLVDALAELEARIDHPAEDLVYEQDAVLRARLASIGDRARAAAATFRAGVVLVEGATVALVGPVNGGKSSLFNALGGSTRALVSPTPGTTRDVIERPVILCGVAVTLLDTAGQRPARGLEAEGIALGRALVEHADLFVVVVPAHEPEAAAEVLRWSEGRHRLIVHNHADRAPVLEGLSTVASEGLGVDALGEAIAHCLLGEEPGGAGVVIASQRQRDRLLEVSEAVERCLAAMASDAGEAIAAQELYGALERLDALTGRDGREAVLEALFSRFCIGK